MSKETQEVKAVYDQELDISESGFEVFEPNQGSRIMKTKSLAKKVNAKMRNIFADYNGCVIIPAQYGAGLMCSLVFKQVSINEINDQLAYAFVPNAIAKKGNDYASRAAAVNSSMVSSRRYHITTAGKSVLSSLYEVNSDKIPWDRVTSEGQSNNLQPGFFNQAPHTSFNTVIQISFTKLMEFVYGSVDPDGGKIYYMAMVGNPVSNNQNMGMPDDWLMTLSVMTEDSMNQMLNELGITFNGAGIAGLETGV